MSIINQELFCEIAAEPPSSQRRESLAHQVRVALDPYNYYEQPFSLPVDREAAIALLEQVKAAVAARGRIGSKTLRPHSFDTFSYLDRSQPWWGFEFETGWRTAEARRQAINAAWDIGVNGVTFDGEGEGNHVCEITFAPAVMSDVVNGSAPASQFIQYMHDHPNDVYNGGQTYIGTHINISFPTSALEQTGSILNNSIALLPVVAEIEGQSVNVRLELFGRPSIYGGFFLQSEGVDYNSRWLEGKVFRTTYNVNQFHKYVRVCEALTRIGQLVQDTPALQDNNIGVTNLLEMYLDPSVEPVFKRNVSWYGSPSRGWIDGTVIARAVAYDDPYYNRSFNPGTHTEDVVLS